MALDEETGQKIRRLREALGYEYRPAFADIFGMTPTRLQSIETGRQRLNSADFRVIYANWPWSLGFILGDEPLEVPDSIASNRPKTTKRDTTLNRKHASNNQESGVIMREEIKKLLKEAVLELKASD